MDRASASAAVESVLQFASRLNESIRDLMMTGPSGPQLNEYRRAAGRVLGYLYTDVLRSIFVAYPDLEPEAIKTRMATPEFPIDRAAAQKIAALMNDVSDWLAHLPDTDKEAFAEGIAQVSSGIADVRAFITKSHPDLTSE